MKTVGDGVTEKGRVETEGGGTADRERTGRTGEAQAAKHTPTHTPTYTHKHIHPHSHVHTDTHTYIYTQT